MSSNKKETKPVERNYIHNDKLPSLLVDNYSLTGREDGMVLISCYTHLPDGLFEQTRFFTPQQSLKRLIDTTCKILDYYPNKIETNKNIETKKTIPKARG